MMRCCFMPRFKFFLKVPSTPQEALKEKDFVHTRVLQEVK